MKRVLTTIPSDRQLIMMAVLSSRYEKLLRIEDKSIQNIESEIKNLQEQDVYIPREFVKLFHKVSQYHARSISIEKGREATFDDLEKSIQSMGLVA